ncbi:GNAT family N-acetyltransferase [Sedimentibacter saalensis]|uniref:Acetyltransferase (GNAT) family protein n=1 Tax=Sedimentibacter saalensis TaxID=130788 RepID=A0A562JB64_9FIRM|nr:GNAT family N-acetyltransferase [Sedimentibacter saalensis]TWH80389.1 acetyltransferase (GNAT) family protein [Sedimentibacter saalensis]
MKNITKRPFMILSDFMAIYQFMIDIYEKDWRNGVPAPFFEYALSSDWSDKTMSHRNMIWEADGDIVGFCFYESQLGKAFFSLRSGYEEIASEMIEHAAKALIDKDGNLKLIIFKGQDAVAEAAIDAGFEKTDEYVDMIFDFNKQLDYKLPKGFSFVEPHKYDMAKALICCWKGFDHEKEGPWDENLDCGYHLYYSPHATPQYDVAIQNEDGDYVCWAGMWWTPQNHLAYMEPLCTVPEYRKKGLAAAALSEMYRRMKPLGATHMTGGSNSFYSKIGYEPMITWTYWSK